MNKDNFETSRNEANKKLLYDAYNYANVQIPIIVNNVNYWVDGEEPEKIPADYFDNPASMTRFQIEKIRWHKDNIADNYVPVLHPWYGTTVVPSALGVDVVFPKGTDPALQGVALTSPEQVKKLHKPDPYHDGLMPRVLSTIDFMKKETDIDVCVTDTQGPLNIALSLAGVDNLFTWFYTNPDEAHALMEFATEVLIDWVKVQKEHAGLDMDKGAYPHGIFMPKGGVAISDDDCTQIDESLYREFVVPYNSKVLKAFGGGSIHFCGSAMHQLEALASTEGLIAVNNFCMGNFEQIYRLQEILAPKKIALMACDFTPLDVEHYYESLLSGVKQEGLILASFPVWSVALSNGSYVCEERNPQVISKRVSDFLNAKLR